VSGGFSYFTQRLAQDIGLDYNRANTLAIEDNQLTGKVKGDIELNDKIIQLSP
jgi:phosphoserine phosphatase